MTHIKRALNTADYLLKCILLGAVNRLLFEWMHPPEWVGIMTVLIQIPLLYWWKFHRRPS